MKMLVLTSMLMLGAQDNQALDAVRFDQNLGADVPTDAPFVNELGDSVTLNDYLKGDQPIVLALAYYRCPMLCTLVLSSMVEGLRPVSLQPGEDYQVVVISIDPRETPELAYGKKQTHLDAFGRPGAEDGWHFLTGEQASIRAVADAIGYGYAYDDKSDQYAHPAGLTILTPNGRVARYLLGLAYNPRDLRLSLVEASGNKIGSPVDQVLLRCFNYDPSTGKYTLAIFTVLRIGAVITVLALIVLVTLLIRRERKQSRRLLVANER